jgi:putative chitinase
LVEFVAFPQEATMRAVDIVRQIAPKARAEYLAAFDAGDARLDEAGVTTPLRLAHLLAQCGAESGGFELTRESLFYKTEKRLIEIFKNMKQDTPLLAGEAKMLLGQEQDLGERFYGVGGVSELYKKNGMNKGRNPGNPGKAKKLGNDRPGDGFLFRGNGLLQTTGGEAHRKAGEKVGVDFFNHPELVTSAEHALKPVLFEWTNSRCNDFADQDDLLSISRAINIGTPDTDRTPNGMKERGDWLEKARTVLEV